MRKKQLCEDSFSGVRSSLIVNVLQVSGGSGNYTWQSSNVSVARVNSQGLVITNGFVGSTQVTAFDVRNSAHFDDSKVSP